MSRLFRSRSAADAETATSMLGLAEAFVEGTAAEGEPLFTWDAAEAGRLDDICERFLLADPPPEYRESMIKAMGAYVGELLVRNGGGHWRYDPKVKEPVVLLPGRVACLPLNRVAKRLELGAEHDLAAYVRFALSGEAAPGAGTAPYGTG